MVGWTVATYTHRSATLPSCLSTDGWTGAGIGAGGDGSGATASAGAGEYVLDSAGAGDAIRGAGDATRGVGGPPPPSAAFWACRFLS